MISTGDRGESIVRDEIPDERMESIREEEDDIVDSSRSTSRCR
jgi:hypothetical protein